MSSTATVVIKAPEDRAERLAKLNITEEQLRNAIIDGNGFWAACTANHPALYRGIVFWGETCRALRDQLVASGYSANDAGGLATAYNKDLKVALLVVTGDEGTGVDEAANPKSKYRKGSLVAAAVEQNRQLSLALGFADEVETHESDGRVTWVLLLRRNHAVKQIEVELSLCARMGLDGKLGGEWIERIFLDPVPYDIEPSAGMVPPPSGPIDVPVTKV